MGGTTISTEEYDPRAHGALCDLCELRHGGVVVPPETRRYAELLIVGEAPGHQEEEYRRPFVGASGVELTKALEAAGVTRASCSLSNTILCRPQARNGNLKAYMAHLRRRNKARKAKKMPPLMMPTDCCRPRLLAEIAKHDNLLLVGAAARIAVYKGPGSEKGLMRSRGFPDIVELDGRRLNVLSTVHSAYVLRMSRWRGIFRSDVAKAVRMARGRLRWSGPDMLYAPKPDELANALAAMRGHISYDVETEPAPGREFDARTDVLRCVGVGGTDLAVCVPWLAVPAEGEEKRARGRGAYYSIPEQIQVDAILTEWFGREKEVVCAHNEQYDHIVMDHYGLPVKRRIFDSVIGHHVAWSELPHDLGFLSAQFTDSKEHKVKSHDAWPDDRSLWHYNMLDLAVTSHAVEALLADPKLLEQATAFKNDMWLSYYCRQMRVVGIRLNVAERDRHFKEQTVKMARAKKAFIETATRALPPSAPERHRKFIANINPGSYPQCRRLLFELWRIKPIPEEEKGYTDGGDPSVSKDILFQLIDKGVPPEIEEAMQHLIDYREALKIRGTYCGKKMVPGEDGRVHAVWNPHVVVSGRLSTNDPNLLNIKGPLRSMFCAEPGHELVFLDKKQLEARVIAWLAQDDEWIATFLSGADIHIVNTAATLDIPQASVTKKQRKFGKTFTYAVQYGASRRKAYRMVKNFRNDKGEREFRDLTQMQSDAAYDRWWSRRHAIKRYHEGGIEFWREHGYQEEPLHGRRRYFLDGEDPTEMANFRIQSTAAADVNDAMKRVLEEFPWGFAGPNTGVVHYNYDSIGVEVPIGEGERVGRRVAELMDSKLGDMPLPVDMQIGLDWYNLREVAL